MFGAILGDIIGSIYEFKNIRQTDFPIVSREAMFTDDTVMTVATAYALLNKAYYAETYKSFGRIYPERGYGGSIAEAYYGSLSVDLVRYAESKLDYYMLDIIRRFRSKFMLEG